MEISTNGDGPQNVPKDMSESGTSKERTTVQKTEAEISLHPLVIMNISEQWTRLRAQNSERQPVQVYGGVLGKQVGRHMELINSFEIKLNEPKNGMPTLDKEYFKKRESQYKEVFPDLDLLGWYTTGEDIPTDADLHLHRQIIEIRESPVMVKLDPQSSNVDKLPVAVFESLVNAADESSIQWQRIPWTLASEQAERIGIDHIAKISTTARNSKSQTSSQVAGQQGAVNMLQARLQLIRDYIVAVQTRELPRNEAIIREIALLVRRLPVMDLDHFDREYKNQCIEAKLTLHVLSMAKVYGLLNDLVTKVNVISFDKTPMGGFGPITRRLPRQQFPL